MSLLPWKRKSPRLPDYDYSQEGAYFVTVCVQGRECLLGKITAGILQLNDAGKMVERWWRKLASKFPSTKIDSFHVVMPNHFHGIVFKLTEGPKGAHMGAPLQKVDVPLQEMVQWFKTMTTNEYVHGVKEHGWPQFKGSLWQRSFYDHVIRDEESLNRIREYISTNPQRWELDRENPRSKGRDDFDRWLATYKTRPMPGKCRGGPACPPSHARRQLGDKGEDLAAAALKKQGYKILERNYITPLGEIDLVARQGKCIVFVEVKTRRSGVFGGPGEAVHPSKQARLRRLADYYLKQKKLQSSPVRFDVVGISFAGDSPQVEIIQGAF